MIGAELVVRDGSQLWARVEPPGFADIFSPRGDFARRSPTPAGPPAGRAQAARPRVHRSAPAPPSSEGRLLSFDPRNRRVPSRTRFEQATCTNRICARPIQGSPCQSRRRCFSEAGREQAIQRARAAATRALELDEAERRSAFHQGTASTAGTGPARNAISSGRWP